MKQFLYTLLITAAIVAVLPAQGTGQITGKVTDQTKNEPLIGATVLVQGTAAGASTDIDGHYSIRNLRPGVYTLRVSYVSYATAVIEKVTVSAAKDAVADVSLLPAAKELQEVVITADALNDSESGVLKIQKNAAVIADAISAETIKRNNSSDAADALKIMSGVTIADGKYAYIRGIGDRYNNTLLNGAAVASTDPEKKSFSYDIIPASLIENLVTAKTFSADRPADFSGGLVQIKTVEFPSRFILDVSTSTGYTPKTNGAPFTRYAGGTTDYLGTDDGTRALPAAVNGVKLSRSAYTPEQLTAIGRSFRNNWKTQGTTAPVNAGLRIGLGDRLTFDDDYYVLGYVASLTYTNSFDRKDYTKNSYIFEGSRFEYAGVNYTNSVTLGAMANLSLKINGTNKLSFKNVVSRVADDETAFNYGANNAYGQYREITGLRYVSRLLRTHQLLGENMLPLLAALKLEWNLSYSNSGRSEPDARQYVYSRDLTETAEPLRFQLDQSLATRFFGTLNEDIYAGGVDVTVKLFDDPQLPAIKAGFVTDNRQRAFSARSFGFKNNPGGNFLKEDSLLMGPVEGIFAPENFSPSFVEITEITKPSDSYTSNQTTAAAYLLLDFDIFSQVKIAAGLRYETTTQKLESSTLTGEPVRISSPNSDVLPGINITWLINSGMNLRFAVSKTLARPEFREMAPFSYYDFISSELVVGNSNLKRTLITNYDIRYEYYPSAAELLAVSFFYKGLANPIEQVLVASASLEPIRSFSNARSARNYGVEFEARKRLSFLHSSLDDFLLQANLSVIRSRIELEGGGFQASSRAMQGQASYIVNAGCYYENQNAGVNAGVTVNRIGQRIHRVGYAGLGDIIEQPRTQVDISVSKTLFAKLSAKLIVRDVLRQKQEFMQQLPTGGKPAEVINRDSGVSLSLSYQL